MIVKIMISTAAAIPTYGTGTGFAGETYHSQIPPTYTAWHSWSWALISFGSDTVYCIRFAM
jgi:hypothetical protein